MDKRKRRHIEQYSDMVARIAPDLHKERTDGVRVLSRTVTFQVTEDCNLACFVAGTKILMSDYTYKNIEDVEVGDEVMGFPEKGVPCFSPTKVTRIYRRQKKTRHIYSKYTGVICTDEHPFFTSNLEWVKAEDIKVGTKLIVFDYAAEDQMGIVEVSDNVIEDENIVDVYNLETEVHTYVANNFAVHNCTYCVSGDTEIRMADYSLKPIKDVKLGDQVLGFDEYPETYDAVSTKFSTVEQLFQRIAKVLKITFETGDRLSITGNHKLLIGTLNGFEYVAASTLKINDYVWIYSEETQKLEERKITSIKALDEEIPVYNIGTSSHTYIANGIAVHNCYQGHKTKKAMSWKTAKKAVDMLLSSTEENNPYINPTISPGIILEFIGGEPFLEIDLIDKIVDYFKTEARRLEHQWAEWFCISICSNGVLYFDERVQRFLMKNRNNISFSVTIDGNKELHDSCRVFHDGKPSYDLAVAAAMDWMSRGYYMGSKITIAPGNVNFLYDALTHMIDLGYVEINANCVYEEGWELPHASVLYSEMKRVADYLFEHDLEDEIYVSLFEDNMFVPMDEEDNQNWCWGKGTPILTTEGYKPIEEVKIGDFVYTEDGTIHPVVNTMSHMADNVVNISMSGVFDLVCTDNHQLYTKSGKKQVKDITDDDFIELFQFPKNINIKSEMDYIYKYSEYSYGRYKLKVYDYMQAQMYATVLRTLNCLLEVRKTDCYELYFSEETYLNSWTYGLKTTPAEPQMVYNITVDTNHSYIAGGIASSNCGGTCDMLCIDPDGNYSICIRYLPSSLGDDQPPIYLGDVDRGLFPTDKEKHCMECMQCITRRSQSTDECFYCPIAKGCAWCFKEGTMITTPSGVKPIEDIQIGDKVITGDGNIKPVEKINKRYTNDTVLIKATGCESIYTTSEHPFLVRKLSEINGTQMYEEPKWIEAISIQPYDKIAKSNNGKDIEWVNVKEVNPDVDGYEVYNMSVADDHTYIANGVIVHNCSAYNYQVTGTVDKRVTYICVMHKARALANAYFWNKYYRKHEDTERFKIYCPDEWALEIISQDELNMLKQLSKED